MFSRCDRIAYTFTLPLFNCYQDIINIYIHDNIVFLMNSIKIHISNVYICTRRSYRVKYMVTQYIDVWWGTYYFLFISQIVKIFTRSMIKLVNFCYFHFSHTNDNHQLKYMFGIYIMDEINFIFRNFFDSFDNNIKSIHYKRSVNKIK